MKRLKIVLPIFIGTLVYSVLSMCIGPKGIWAMSQLTRERTRVSANLESLYIANEDLNSRFQNLSADPDTISVYAHELGYVANGEKLIKLAGFTGGIDRNFDSGSAISVIKPAFLPEWVCKFFGILSGVCSFFMLSYILTARSHDHQKRRA